MSPTHLAHTRRGHAMSPEERGLRLILLARLYYDCHLNLVQCGALFSISRESVKRAFRQARLPLRPQGRS